MNRLQALSAFFVAVLGVLSACDQDRETTIRFWAFGREGEVVQEQVARFELENPGVHVELQQIPWSAAHEKLLTAFVGRSTPDVTQLGNTWISELAALDALEPLDPWISSSDVVRATDYFEGIWETNVLDGTVLGIPWYVDTRVLFYRSDILKSAGFDSVPSNWDGWLEAMHAVKRVVGPEKYAILLPVNEWPPPVILGLQAGSTLLDADGASGRFSSPEFRAALSFYLELFREGLAPPVRNNDVANLYQEFARGYFSMYITGPWNLGEFRRRMPPELQDAWATAPMPGPTGPGVSLAGGSSLVLFRRSEKKRAAWRLIEFLSRTEEQVAFYELVGNLPSRRQAWADSALAKDEKLAAFAEQLDRAVTTPKIPEWELITTRIQERVESVVNGSADLDSAIVALDRDVWRILEKRRWLLTHRQPSVTGGSR
jgi:multiple sugar transport system substrate-binding protein